MVNEPLVRVIPAGIPGYVCDWIVDDSRARASRTPDAPVSWPADHWITGLLWHFASRANETDWRYTIVASESAFLATYGRKGFSTWHADDVLKPTDASLPSALRGLTRKLSVTLMLNESSDYSGGDFRIKREGAAETELDPALFRRKGTVIIHPSYALTSVRPVTKGVKHSLVTWLLGPLTT